MHSFNLEYGSCVKEHVKDEAEDESGEKEETDPPETEADVDKGDEFEVDIKSDTESIKLSIILVN